MPKDSLRAQILEQARKDGEYIASLPLHQRRSLELQYEAMQREIAYGAACDRAARSSNQ